MYRLYLLDADNTLFDFAQAEEYALRSASEAFGLGCGAEDVREYSQINEALWKAYERGEIAQDRLRTERFARYLAGRSEADPKVFAEAFVQGLGEAAFLFPEAGALVKALHAKAKLVLFTNGISEVQRSRIAKSGLEEYFDGLCISGELGFQKPDPRMVEAAMAMAGIADKSAVLVVGDSQTADIECARRAGVDSCLYNPQGHAVVVRPTYEVKSLMEIPELGR